MPETIDSELITLAVEGNQAALEKVLRGVQDLVFTLSVRMLGSVPDAQDASQEILIRIMTNLGSFRADSEFTTWVYRISSNFLISYKKSMFSQYPLSFDFYGEDILSQGNQVEHDIPEAERAELAGELMRSCSNVMLQCFSPTDRCIFIFGTMFHLDSRVAADTLDITAENYRQRLSRLRKKMATFLQGHCALAGSMNCSCSSRVDYALSQGRICRGNHQFSHLKETDLQTVATNVDSMNRLDDTATLFDSLPTYKSPVDSKKILSILLDTGALDFLNPERKTQ